MLCIVIQRGTRTQGKKIIELKKKKQGRKSCTFGLASALRTGAWKRSSGSVTVQFWYVSGKSRLDFQKKKDKKKLRKRCTHLRDK